MAHLLILGQTLSGKSTLAKKLANAYKSQGIAVLVHDPVGDPEWNADFRTANAEEFFKVYNDSRQCAVFFDEAGETCEEFRHEITKTATRGRHRGHRNHYIAQRGTLILRTIRDQCSGLFPRPRKNLIRTRKLCNRQRRVSESPRSATMRPSSRPAPNI